MPVPTSPSRPASESGARWTVVAARTLLHCHQHLAQRLHAGVAWGPAQLLPRPGGIEGGKVERQLEQVRGDVLAGAA